MLARMDPIEGAADLILVRHHNRTGDGRAMQRAADRGDLTRLRSGAYVSAAIWDRLPEDDRRRLEAAAMAEMHPAFVASHRSAAALWHVPTIRPPDGLVHARVTVAAGSRTEHGVRKHATHDPEQHLAAVDGIACTTLERTALDLAATEAFDEAVVALDWVLAQGITKDRLRQVLDEWAPARGRHRIEAALAFADRDSGSPGESLSRVLIADAGLPAPILQQPFFDRRGLIGYVDFWWPDFGLIGEFDGLKKYREADLLAGRTPAQVVIAEKVREDRLRATTGHPHVHRWTWPTLRTRGALARDLQLAGLPRLR
ncbi:MAG TPA: hypothetical protein VIG76_13760 [Amnibacterium sp.]|jgi:hypothetical protein|uniref:hypothetical protein n=1 Tax=Amnibacterium sp. TaxID=1872496 RepID=UPI002F91F969